MQHPIDLYVTFAFMELYITEISLCVWTEWTLLSQKLLRVIYSASPRHFNRSCFVDIKSLLNLGQAHVPCPSTGYIYTYLFMTKTYNFIVRKLYIFSCQNVWISTFWSLNVFIIGIFMHYFLIILTVKYWYSTIHVPFLIS